MVPLGEVAVKTERPYGNAARMMGDYVLVEREGGKVRRLDTPRIAAGMVDVLIVAERADVFAVDGACRA